MNILEDLWYGNIAPMERLDYRTEEYGTFCGFTRKTRNACCPL